MEPKIELTKEQSQKLESIENYLESHKPLNGTNETLEVITSTSQVKDSDVLIYLQEFPKPIIEIIIPKSIEEQKTTTGIFIDSYVYIPLYDFKNAEIYFTEPQNKLISIQDELLIELETKNTPRYLYKVKEIISSS